MHCASLAELLARLPVSVRATAASQERPATRRLATIGVFFFALAAAHARQIERISVDSAGAEGNGSSVASVLSADGRASAFSSFATNLVAGDTNGFRDVFVRDNASHATLRVSVSSTGLQANGASYSPSLSGDGRFIAFTSEASNLVSGDTNGVADVFVYDRDPDGNGVFDEGVGVTVRVSVDSLGLEAHGGSYGAYSHTISADGRLVVFRSDASDLVAGDLNGKSDIFVHERSSGLTTRVSVDSAGFEANNGSSLATISGDGAVVAFHSDANNLVPGDTNGVTDVFTHDLLTGVTTRVSVDSAGVQFSRACSAPALSADGAVVAFRRREPYSASVYSLFVRDNLTGVTQQLTTGFYSSWSVWSHELYGQWATGLGFAAVSADGSRVAFIACSGSSYSYSGWPSSFFSASVKTDVLVWDRANAWSTSVASYSLGNFANESQALAASPFYAPSLSDDGWKLAFESDSPNLVAGDTNGLRDAFVCDVLYGAALGTNYCASQSNSTGQRALISAVGYASVAAHTLSLRTTNLPPNVGGLFFYGAAATNVPFGDGRLCVGGALQRLPVFAANAEGIATSTDVFAAPMPILPIVAGSTFYFQSVYRDPAAMQSGFNLSHGVAVSFVP